ncbi:MAG TPA: DUF3379 family protein, partial [Steroidobacteraceae bacterium]|nr:DUF3379 family protein [Steroidobacteraceae bacterium]
MNCLEFRRHVGAEPSSTVAAVAAHREECAACAGFQDEMQALDRVLGKAMRIDVVSGTRAATAPAAAAVGRVSGPSRARPGTVRPRRWLAMAASLVAGVLVATT